MLESLARITKLQKLHCYADVLIKQQLIAALPAQEDSTARIDAAFEERSLSLTLQTLNLNRLLQDRNSIPLALSGSVDTVDLHFDGLVDIAAVEPELEGGFSIGSSDPNWLPGLAGNAMPQLGAMELRGTVVGSAAGVGVRSAINGAVANGQLEIRFEPRESRLRLFAAATLEKLDGSHR